jgi:hypothetical protein
VLLPPGASLNRTLFVRSLLTPFAQGEPSPPGFELFAATVIQNVVSGAVAAGVPGLADAFAGASIIVTVPAYQPPRSVPPPLANPGIVAKIVGGVLGGMALFLLARAYYCPGRGRFRPPEGGAETALAKAQGALRVIRRASVVAANAIAAPFRRGSVATGRRASALTAAPPPTTQPAARRGSAAAFTGVHPDSVEFEIVPSRRGSAAQGRDSKPPSRRASAAPAPVDILRVHARSLDVVDTDTAF